MKWLCIDSVDRFGCFFDVSKFYTLQLLQLQHGRAAPPDLISDRIAILAKDRTPYRCTRNFGDMIRGIFTVCHDVLPFNHECSDTGQL